MFTPPCWSILCNGTCSLEGVLKFASGAQVSQWERCVPSEGQKATVTCSCSISYFLEGRRYPLVQMVWLQLNCRECRRTCRVRMCQQVSQGWNGLLTASGTRICRVVSCRRGPGSCSSNSCEEGISAGVAEMCVCTHAWEENSDRRKYILKSVFHVSGLEWSLWSIFTEERTFFVLFKGQKGICIFNACFWLLRDNVVFCSIRQWNILLCSQNIDWNISLLAA